MHSRHTYIKRPTAAHECIELPCKTPTGCHIASECWAHEIKLTLHKDQGGYVGVNGECLICTAEAGEQCRYSEGKK